MALLTSCAGEVGVLTIDRPGRHNALSREMWLALPAAIDQLARPPVRVIVVTGKGLSFAAGADLKEIERLSDRRQAEEFWSAIERGLDALWQCRLPSLAMINGPCIGGGFLIALACDLRYASAHATFALPLARLGIVIDSLNLARLSLELGPAFTREMVFTGQTVDAGTALKAGFLNGLCQAEDLPELVFQRARAIAANSENTILAAKQFLNRSARTLAANSPADEALVVESYISDDLRDRLARYRRREE